MLKVGLIVDIALRGRIAVSVAAGRGGVGGGRIRHGERRAKGRIIVNLVDKRSSGDGRVDLLDSSPPQRIFRRQK